MSIFGKAVRSQMKMTENSIIPCAFFGNNVVWNCDPVIYATFRGDTPASYYAVVREKVRERFTEATRI